MKLPKLSIVIPTKNEEQNIDRCLKSIFKQKYLKTKIEVIVVDDYSTDSTLSIAKKYPVKILTHDNQHGEIGKKIGFDNAIGEYFMYLDADVELGDSKTLSLLLEPLMSDNKVVASFTDESAGPKSNAFEKYLSLDKLQRDPLFKYLSPEIEECIVKSFKNWFLCRYEIDKIPPAGRCLYRKSILNSLIKKENEFLELDILVQLVESNHKYFAYVPKAKIYHHHVKSLRELVKKRKYNLIKVYKRFYDKKKYKWINFNSTKDKLKIFFWILFANSIIGPLISGIYKSFKYKTTVGLYDFIVIPLLTDLYIYLTIKDGELFKKLFINRS